MTESVQTALIGVAGAILGALVTAFIQPLWTVLLGRQSRLHVEIAHNHFQLPKFLQESISEYLRNYKLNIRPTEQVKDKLRTLDRKGGLSLIKIANRSKRSIDDLAIHLDGSREFICDLTIDGKMRESVFARSYVIGNLRAGAECNLALWTTSDLTERWSSSRTMIQISAKEYDTISIKFPAPGYVIAEKMLFSRKAVWSILGIILVLSNFVAFVGSGLFLATK